MFFASVLGVFDAKMKSSECRKENHTLLEATNTHNHS